MKITQLKAQVKNPDRVSIYVNEKYSFSLTLDQLLTEKLKKGDVLDDARLEQLKKLSGEGKLRARALEWVMGRPHSAYELRQYLYRKKAEKEHSESVVQEFIDKGYINDEAFARWFAEGRQRKNKSTRAIKSELMSKGVSPVTIQNIVTELETTDEQALQTLVSKLSNRSRYADKDKLTRYLISKGFSYADVKQALDSHGAED